VAPTFYLPIGGRTSSDFTFPSDVMAVLVNVTIVQPTASGGDVTLFPGDAPARPLASSVNPSTPIAVNAAATGIPTSGANAGTFALFSTDQLDVIVDVVGYFR